MNQIKTLLELLLFGAFIYALNTYGYPIIETALPDIGIKNSDGIYWGSMIGIDVLTGFVIYRTLKRSRNFSGKKELNPFGLPAKLILLGILIVLGNMGCQTLLIDFWLYALEAAPAESESMETLVRVASKGLADDMVLWATVEYLLYLILAILVAPVMEELLFRRYIFQRLLKAKYSLWAATLISSLMFSLWHLPNSAQAFHSFLGGVVFALAYQYSGRIAFSIFLHCLFNALVEASGWLDIWISISHTPIWIYSTTILVSILMLIGGLWYLAKYGRETLN